MDIKTAEQSFYNDKLRIQTLRKDLVRKPSFSSYPDKGWKLIAV